MEDPNDSYIEVREQVRRGNFVLLNQVLTCASAVLGFFTLTQLFDPSLIITVLPWLAIGSLYWSNGFSGFATPERSPRPDVLWPLLSAGIFGSLSTAMIMPNLTASQTLLRYWLPLSVVLMVPLGFAIRRFEKRKIRWIWLLPLCFLSTALPSAFTIISEANYRLDNNKRHFANGIVKTKERQSGKGGGYTYSVYVSLTDGRTIPAYFTISRDDYNSISVGDTARLVSGSGALGAQWFYLSGL